MSGKVILKGELKKYKKVETFLHQLFAIDFVLLIVTGILRVFGAGAIFKAAHIFSGYIFLALFLFHLLYLIVLGISTNIPLEEVPFFVKLNEIVKYLKGEKENCGKFSLPERIDYLALIALSTIISVTGLFLRFPRLIPVTTDISTLYSISRIHYFAGIAVTFWVFGYHLYFTVLNPLPGNTPSSIFGRELSPEAVFKHRPRWYESLKKEGIIETIEERIDRDMIDREKVTTLLSEGNEFFKRGDYLQAEKLYRQAVDLYPAYSQAQYNLAILYLRTGKIDEAINEYRRFLEIDPFNPLAAKVRKKIKELRGEE